MTSTELPKLRGSEKQVAWAEQIRSDGLNPQEYGPKDVPIAVRLLPIIGVAAGKIHDARDWIENKGMDVLPMLFNAHFGLTENRETTPLARMAQANKMAYSLVAKAISSGGRMGEDDSWDFGYAAGGIDKAREIASALGIEFDQAAAQAGVKKAANRGGR